MNFVRTMAGALGTSLAVTIWDDHSKIARSEMVSSLHPEGTVRALEASGMSHSTIVGTIANLVDKEALTISVNHVFLIFTLVFLVGAILIWFSPRAKGNVEGGHAH